MINEELNNIEEILPRGNYYFRFVFLFLFFVLIFCKLYETENKNKKIELILKLGFNKPDVSRGLYYLIVTCCYL